MRAPKRWKMAILIWIAIYPTITLIFLLGGKIVMEINPLPLRTLCLTAVIVPLMVFVLIPVLSKLLGGWLHK